MRLEGLLGKGLKRAGIRPATPGRLLAGTGGQRPVVPGSPALRHNSYTPALFLSPPFPFHSIIFAVFFSFLASPFSKMLQAALSSSRVLLLPLLYLSVQWASILFFSHSSGAASSRKPSAALPVRTAVPLFWASKHSGLASHHSLIATLNLDLCPLELLRKTTSTNGSSYSPECSSHDGWCTSRPSGTLEE